MLEELEGNITYTLKHLSYSVATEATTCHSEGGTTEESLRLLAWQDPSLKLRMTWWDTPFL